jgi:hypothetical protein
MSYKYNLFIVNHPLTNCPTDFIEAPYGIEG